MTETTKTRFVCDRCYTDVYDKMPPNWGEIYFKAQDMPRLIGQSHASPGGVKTLPGHLCAVCTGKLVEWFVDRKPLA